MDRKKLLSDNSRITDEYIIFKFRKFRFIYGRETRENHCIEYYNAARGHPRIQN